MCTPCATKIVEKNMPTKYAKILKKKLNSRGFHGSERFLVRFKKDNYAFEPRVIIDKIWIATRVRIYTTAINILCSLERQINYVSE